MDRRLYWFLHTFCLCGIRFSFAVETSCSHAQVLGKATITRMGLGPEEGSNWGAGLPSCESENLSGAFRSALDLRLRAAAYLTNWAC